VAGVESDKRRWIERGEELEMSEEREGRQQCKRANKRETAGVRTLDSSSIGRTGERHSAPRAEAATSRFKRTDVVEEKS
jgi:hypothetical protein